MFGKRSFALVCLLLTLNFFLVQISAELEHEDEMVAKRFLLNKKKSTTAKTPTTTKQGGGAINALIPTTSSASKFRPSITTKSPSVTSKSPSSTKEACGVISPCKNGGTCKTLSSGTFYCFCTSDYYGKTCENKFISTGNDNKDRGKTDHCAKKPCKNSGECVGLRTTFYCRCKLPFYGTSCEKKI